MQTDQVVCAIVMSLISTAIFAVLVWRILEDRQQRQTQDIEQGIAQEDKHRRFGRTEYNDFARISNITAQQPNLTI
jgi:membrane protein implicated in regulation of membrane protease activity